jgi:hypothetical protein
MSTVSAAARAAYAAGLSVVPPREDGSKRPIGAWKAYQHVRASVDQLHAWYGPCTGLGLVTGRVSGNLEVLEFDERAIYERFVAHARQTGLGDLVDRIEQGYLSDTPGGGVHWPYRCDAIEGNVKLATRPKRPDERRDPRDTTKTLIETRGEGGFIVEAPSNGRVHPSGGAYRLRAGRFATIATITPDERRALHQLAQTFHQPAARQAQAAAVAGGDGGRPGDDFNARARWADVLDGWTAVCTVDGVTHWRRPGKASGTSATTGHGGRDLLIVFSTSTAFAVTTSDAPRGYTKFAAYAVLHHDGDYTAAARALREQGYGDDPTASRLLSPGDPMTSARAFTAQSYTLDGTPLLRHQAGTFYVYRPGAGAYLEHDEATVRATLYAPSPTCRRTPPRPAGSRRTRSTRWTYSPARTGCCTSRRARCTRRHRTSTRGTRSISPTTPTRRTPVSGWRSCIRCGPTTRRPSPRYRRSLATCSPSTPGSRRSS